MKRVLIASDIHFPKHCPKAVKTLLRAKHPLEDKSFKRRFVENEWSYRGEK